MVQLAAASLMNLSYMQGHARKCYSLAFLRRCLSISCAYWKNHGMQRQLSFATFPPLNSVSYQTASGVMLEYDSDGRGMLTRRVLLVSVACALHCANNSSKIRQRNKSGVVLLALAQPGRC